MTDDIKAQIDAQFEDDDQDPPASHASSYGCTTTR